MKNAISLQKSIAEVTIQSAYERFVLVKKNMNLSDATIKSYDEAFKNFTKFFNAENYCMDITNEVVEDYVDYLINKRGNLSSVTVNSYLRGLRAILYFFMERDYMSRFKVSLIKQEKKIKETYTDDELKRLLKKPDVKKCDFSEYRNWVLSNYLFGTGNRLSTICNLKIQDIDFKNHEIVLRKVKNRRQYIIPLSIKLEKILTEYLQYRKGESDDYLFCNRYGTQLNKNTISTAIRRYNHSREVTKTSIHLYRHTFAKSWILSGGDIFRLKSILGHSSIDIVKEYAEMFGNDLKHNFDKFNPLDNFGDYNEGRKSLNMNKS